MSSVRDKDCKMGKKESEKRTSAREMCFFIYYKLSKGRIDTDRHIR